MGKHEHKDNAGEERKISGNGHRPDREIPPDDPGGKHEKDEKDE